MSAPEPYDGRLTTLEATIAAEGLLAAFHERDPLFPQMFFQADRDTLGAIIAYADLAIRGFAREAGETSTTIRQGLRLLVSDSQIKIERNEDDA